MRNNERFDAVIVGAGAAGCLYAARLAAAGKSVVVLEAGPAWRLSDLVSSQLWARRLKWRGAPVLLAGEDRVAHNSGTGSGLGGAALHHYATWPRYSEEVFRMHSVHGRGFDWPFEYEDLRVNYDRIQSEVGISGDADAEPWRPPGAPYPMPPLKTFRHGELLRSGFEKSGLPVAPLPLAINSIAYKGRAACIYDGWCDAGCPIGALANPLVTYLPQAERDGATFVTDAEVTRLLASRDGRVEAVEYVHDDRKKTIHADVIVLAASVVQNPRILLNSHSPAFPDGVGNSTGQVGRYLTGEAAVLCYGLFNEDTQCHLGVNAGQYTYREGLRNEARPGAFGGIQWQLGPAVKPNDLFGIAVTRMDLYGRALSTFMQRASRSFAYMIGFCAGVPFADNRVTLSDREDHLGVPLARVTHRHPPDISAMRSYMIEQGNAALAAAGAEEIWHGPPVTGHLVGGTLFGTNPRHSVVDGYGRCHDAGNVIVAGSGLFPSSGGISPTYTLHAVADRSTEFLLRNWKEIRGDGVRGK